MEKKDEEHEKMKEEIVCLKKNVDQLNKNLKISQALDDIFILQISLPEKPSLGYVGESSRKGVANPNTCKK